MKTNRKGQALLVVISILAILFMVGIALFILSQAERTAAHSNLDSLRARYISEAGTVYARKILQLDKEANLIDSPDDLTFKNFSGEDVDLDEDGKTESRWFNVADNQGMPFGRFSIKICDEASKVNLNTVSQETLGQLFSLLGINTSKINTLLSGRPFNAIEQAGSLLGKENFALGRNFLSVYSKDRQIDLEREPRTYLNSSSGQSILEAFLASGIKEAYQKAANLKDASDLDLSQAYLVEFSSGNIRPNQLLAGSSWQNKGLFYEAVQGQDAGRFIWSNLAVEDGEYFCFLYGPNNFGDSDVIGEVYLDLGGLTGELLHSGEGLEKKVKVSSGALSLYIKPVKDKTSRFSDIKLISPNSKKGLNQKIITGTEALVINELMVKPSKALLINPVKLNPGENSLTEFTQIKPGSYYLKVFADKEGGLVGDVNIHGQTTANLYDKGYFTQSVDVDAGKKLTVEIKNNSLNTTTFKGIEILQQPDLEWIEILNISPSEIDLSNFSIEAYSTRDELIPGWPGRIPEGTKIEPYQHLVLAVDNNDGKPAPSRLRGNGISFQKVWGFNAVGLIFDEYLNSIDKSFNLLPDEGAKIILKDNLGAPVDRVEYQQGQVKDFVSLERADPTAKIDTDYNGFFDGWFLCEAKASATPGSTNENAGMYTRDEDNKLLKHTPNEVVVFNRPISGLTEVEELSTGKAWEKFSLLDLSRMEDHFAYKAEDLDLAGHYKSGEFVEKGDVFESLHRGDTGVWEFKVANGSYLLSILTDNLLTDGQGIQAAYNTSDKAEFKDFSSIPFTQGLAFYGRVVLGEGTSVLELKIINDTEKRLALKKIRLEPVNIVPGRINVNTASTEVLRSVLSKESLVGEILLNRPIGMKYGLNLGVGELFLLDPEFLLFHNYLTVKSDLYEINCRGEYIPAGKSMVYQNIRTIVERGD